MFMELLRVAVLGENMLMRKLNRINLIMEQSMTNLEIIQKYKKNELVIVEWLQT